MIGELEIERSRIDLKVLGAFFVLLCSSLDMFAQEFGGVSLSPKRIVFAGRERTSEVRFQIVGLVH